MTAPGNLWFVDSNVLLYRHDARNPAKRLRAGLWLDPLGDAALARISWQVLNEFYDNATRKFGLSRALAREAVTLYQSWKPLEFNVGVMQRAWHWTDRAQLRHWDALVLASAEILRCRYLLSEDFQHGRTYGSVRVVNPFAVTPEEML